MFVAITLLRWAPSKARKAPKMQEQNNNRRMCQPMRPTSLHRKRMSEEKSGNQWRQQLIEPSLSSNTSRTYRALQKIQLSRDCPPANAPQLPQWPQSPGNESMKRIIVFKEGNISGNLYFFPDPLPPVHSRQVCLDLVCTPRWSEDRGQTLQAVK